MAALATVLGAAAHLPAVAGGWFSDDYPLLVDNTKLHSAPLFEPWRLFAEKHSAWDYLPVRDLTYRIELALFGLTPLGFHLGNVLFFALACIATLLATRSVLRALRGVGGDSFEDAAVVVATVLFAAHPAHVESVAWISSRKDVLSGVFALAGVWRFADAIAGERPRWRGIGWAALLFALGCLAKPSVLPLAPLLALLALARYARDLPLRVAAVRASLVALPFLLIAAGSVVVAARFEATRFTPVEEDLFGSTLRPLGPVPLALRILGEFVRVALAPVRPHLHHDVRMPGIAGAALLATGAAAILAALWGVWALVRRRSIVAFGVVASVAFTVPFLQLIQFRTSSEMSERWLYLPSFGLAVAAGGLVARLLAGRWRIPAMVGAAALAAAGLGITAHRSWEWTSDDRLADAEAARAPGDLSAVSFAVTVWGRELRYDDARRLASGIQDEAFRQRILLIADGWQAIAEGRMADARRTLAALASMGKAPRTTVAEAYLAYRAGAGAEAFRIYSEAGVVGAMRKLRDASLPKLAELERRVAADPANVAHLEALGDLQADLHLEDEATATYRRVLELAPDRDETRYNLAMVLRRIGRVDEASGMFRAVADRLPDAWNEVAVCESAQGRSGEAERAFLKAVSATPSDWRPAFNLALLYLTLHRPADARAMFTVARERAVAGGLPVSSIDEQLRRLEP